MKLIEITNTEDNPDINAHAVARIALKDEFEIDKLNSYIELHSIGKEKIAKVLAYNFHTIVQSVIGDDQALKNEVITLLSPEEEDVDEAEEVNVKVEPGEKTKKAVEEVLQQFEDSLDENESKKAISNILRKYIG